MYRKPVIHRQRDQSNSSTSRYGTNKRVTFAGSDANQGTRGGLADRNRNTGGTRNTAVGSSRNTTVSRNNTVGSRNTVGGSRNTVVGSRSPDRGVKSTVGGSRGTERTSRSLDRGTRGTGKGTKSPDRGARSLERGTRGTGKGTKSPERGARSLERGTRVTGTGTRSPERGGARSPERGKGGKDGKGSKDGSGGKMDPRKQATLMNYSQAIEENVDLEKIWPDVEEIFTKQEARDIKHAKGREKMRTFVDCVASKDDAAFDGLVKGLRRDYRWLGKRLMQGVKEEEARLQQAGDGVKQKIALALLTTRISERQKETIIANVSDVVDGELQSKSLRVSIPDHRASAELDHINTKLRKIINQEVDPLLYGPGYRTQLSPQEVDDVTTKLENMLTEMNVIQDCYQQMGVHAYSNSGRPLPNILCQKIEETRTAVDILQKEKKELLKEKTELAKERTNQGKDVGALETRNRNLELHNRTLETECGKLDQAVRKLSMIKESLEIEKRKLQDDNSKLSSSNQNFQTENWNLGLKFRRVEELNQKLTRENQKLISKNHLKKDPYGPHSLTALKMENKTLVDTKSKLKTDMGKLEGEKRQLLIRNQKLESENDNLRDQKRKLMMDKKKYLEDNHHLKTEAKRLAIGNAQPGFLPPIAEARGRRSRSLDDDDFNDQKDNKSSKSHSKRNTSPTRSNSTKPKSNGSNRSSQGSNSRTYSSQTNKYRASVYDYRPGISSTQTSPTPRYGNKA